MKNLSTGKRILAFVCALVLALGVGMQGNVITARAYDWPLDWDANGNVTKTTTSYDEYKASKRALLQEYVVFLEEFAEELAEELAEETGGNSDDLEMEHRGVDLQIQELLKDVNSGESLERFLSDPRKANKIFELFEKHGELVFLIDKDGEEYADFLAELSMARAFAKWLQNEAAVSAGPSKTPEEIAIEKLEKDLSFYHPLIQMTGTPILMVNLGEWHNLGYKVMQKIAKKVSDGYNVALFMRYEKKPLFVLIPAGSTVDLSLDWYGPLCLSELYVDITEEYLAQDKSLSKFLKLKNILDARAVAAAAAE